MANSPSPQTRWSRESFTKAASGSAKTLPYAGEVSVIVTTAPDRPTIQVARSSFGQPRTEFVDRVVRSLFGTQEDGSPHHWELGMETNKPDGKRVVIPVDNPVVAAFLEEKVNSPEIGA